MFFLVQSAQPSRMRLVAPAERDLRMRRSLEFASRAVCVLATVAHTRALIIHQGVPFNLAQVTESY